MVSDPYTEVIGKKIIPCAALLGLANDSQPISPPEAR